MDNEDIEGGPDEYSEIEYCEGGIGTSGGKHLKCLNENDMLMQSLNET
jgi:hypothetical protein